MKFLWIIIALLFVLNVLIFAFNKTFIYNGIFLTYLSGKTGPTIYDLEKFPYSTIPKSSVAYQFGKSDEKQFTAKQLSYLQKLKTSSFLVIKNDTVVNESYFLNHRQETVSNSFSAAKTIVALLIGIALEEGHIKSLDESASIYLPEFRTPSLSRISIRHLLMMASGLDWSEGTWSPFTKNAASYYGEELRKVATKQKLEQNPGEEFIYQSGNSQLLGFVVEAATGKDLSDYAYQKIWSKIGTEHDAYWSKDREDGDEKAFCCFYSTTRDFAKIGKLILQKGQWNGQQIISESYMTEMYENPDLRTEEGVANTRYGLHIWTIWEGDKQIQYCRGIQGQYIISIPHDNMVIVRTGSKRLKNYHELVSSTDPNFDPVKVGHPSEVFEYISIARSLANSKK